MKKHDYKPSAIKKDVCDWSGEGCLQVAFRDGGYDIGNGSYVLSDDLSDLCEKLGVRYYGFGQAFRILSGSKIIAIQKNAEVENTDHATYFDDIEKCLFLNDVTGLIVIK